MQFGNQFGLSLYNGKDKSWKNNKPQPVINKGEVIETLREQVTAEPTPPDTEATYELAVTAIKKARTVDTLEGYKKDIADRFKNGKLTQYQKVELERLLITKQMNLK